MLLSKILVLDLSIIPHPHFDDNILVDIFFDLHQVYCLVIFSFFKSVILKLYSERQSTSHLRKC